MLWINFYSIYKIKHFLSGRKKNEEFNSNSKLYNKEVLKIHDEELQKHKDFIKSDLKKNFY